MGRGEKDTEIWGAEESGGLKCEGEAKAPRRKNNFGFVFACSVSDLGSGGSEWAAGSAVRSCSGRAAEERGCAGGIILFLQCSRLDAFFSDDFLATCVCCCS